MKYLSIIIFLGACFVGKGQSKEIIIESPHGIASGRLMIRLSSGREIDADSAYDKLAKLVFLVDRVDSLQKRIEYLERYSVIYDPTAPKQKPTYNGFNASKQ